MTADAARISALCAEARGVIANAWGVKDLWRARELVTQIESQALRALDACRAATPLIEDTHAVQNPR